jgi:hypothetical protein
MSDAPASPPAPSSRLDLPWWGRAPIAAAAGALLGAATAWAGESASNPARLFALCPLLAAGNAALADVGRRPLSPLAAALAGVAALISVGCLSAAGAALSTILLGGFIAARLVGGGRHRQTRRYLLFAIGAVAGPVATILSWRLVHATAPGEPLAVGIGAFHLLFWWPVAGAEAALAWSAARARGRDGAPDLDFEERIARDAAVFEALAREIGRRVAAERARGTAAAGETGGGRGGAGDAPRAAEEPEKG